MNELKIEYVGGFRVISKHLVWKHNANFAIIIDAIVNIYNQKLMTGQLLKIGEFNSVRISNGYLSRSTGLSLDVIKANLKKIEKIGFIVAIKRGQGNTRHYVINIEALNKYIESLEPEFNDWFKKSLESSKKDKAKSYEADEKRINESFSQINSHYKESTGENLIPANQLVQNQPTQNGKTSQPEDVKPTVVNNTKNTFKRVVKTTTPEDKTENVVVVQVFNNKDEKGIYYLYEVEGFEKRVYLKEYTEYMENINRLSDKEREELDQQVSDYDFGPLEEIVFYEDLTPSEIEEELKIEAERKFAWLRKTPIHKIMKTIDRNVESVKRKRKREERRIYETTKEPASSEVSIANWKKLKEAYDNLPNIENQGRFFDSKEDLKNFKKLSMYRQEYVISKVTAMKKSNKTTSRPAIYIEEAMLDKLPVIKNTKEIINVIL